MDELKKPEEWCEILGAQIMDPDGWRHDNKDWNEPITKAEFDERMQQCTINMNGYVPYRSTLLIAPNGDKFREDRFLYYFFHRSGRKEFGPYADLEEAKTAFQMRYGYWPLDPIEVRPYVLGTEREKR